MKCYRMCSLIIVVALAISGVYHVNELLKFSDRLLFVIFSIACVLFFLVSIKYATMEILIKTPWREFMEIFVNIKEGAAIGFGIATSERRALGGFTWD